MKRKVILLFLLFVFALSGCNKKEEKGEKTQYISSNGLIDIYVIDENSIVAKEDKYQIKQPDSVPSSIEEVISYMKEDFPKGIEYTNYILDENNNVEFDFVLKESTREQLVLFDAALTKTVSQINDIGTITIDMNNDKGESVRKNTYIDDSFYYYGESEDMPENTRSVVVYIPDESGKLARHVYEVNISFDDSEEKHVIGFLADYGVIPKDTKLNCSAIVGKICYIDLNEEFIKSADNVDQELAVYGIVNSMTSIDAIDYVQITVDGDTVSDYGGVDISEPLSFDIDK